MTDRTDKDRANRILEVVRIYQKGCSNAGPIAYANGIGPVDPGECTDCVQAFLKEVDGALQGWVNDAKPPVQIPPNVGVSVTFYLTVPSAEVDTTITLDRVPALGPHVFTEGLEAAVATTNGLVNATDARSMTAEEVAEYRKREREESQEDDDDG